MKKKFALSMMFMIVFNILFTKESIFAADLQYSVMNIENYHGKGVDVYIHSQAVGITENDIDNILSDHPDAECLNIYEVATSDS